MAEDMHKIIPEYFGAANCFSGFKSYFPEIFNPDDYEAIFVIKGGPGTGKSSFMKNILKDFKDFCQCEAIFCSSDRNSLDGVIIENNQKRTAIIDGTAPHETDAKIPGAVDLIVNLGDMWEEKFLTSRREKITVLSKEKKSEYTTAYKYLSVAKEAYESYLEFTKKSYNREIGLKIAREISQEFKKTGSKSKTRLLSAFGKDGQIKLSFPEKLIEKKISLKLSERVRAFFMNDLKTALDLNEISYTSFPSVPYDSGFDAFYIPDKKIYIEYGEEDLNISSQGIENEISPVTEERVKGFYDIYLSALQNAKRHFNIASEIHFALEEIYVSSMNFEKITPLFDKTKLKIEKMLEINT